MKYILVVAIAFFISACGSSENENTNTAQTLTSINMLVNKTYSVSKGDKLNKITDDTIVEITKTEDVTEVVLLQGEAVIILAQ